MDDYEEWRKRKRAQRQRETEMYDRPVRDEWSIALDMNQPFLIAVIVIIIILAILYITTP